MDNIQIDVLLIAINAAGLAFSLWGLQIAYDMEKHSLSISARKLKVFEAKLEKTNRLANMMILQGVFLLLSTAMIIWHYFTMMSRLFVR